MTPPETSSGVMDRVRERAYAAGVPLSVHFDLTYRCNERCVHCYLDHDDRGEVTTREAERILDQLAAAGTLFLIFSGGELFLRADFFDLLEHARRLRFDVKVKTNGLLIGAAEASRLRDLGVRQIQISIYSHRDQVHDAITKVRGSLGRSVAAIRRLVACGLRVTVANVLMRQNASDYEGVRALAAALGAEYTMDPTITPRMDGDTSILTMRIPQAQMLRVFTDRSLVDPGFCAPPSTSVRAEALDDRPCSAGHISCYITPYAEVYPCVQFPLALGSLRQQRFEEIWRGSSALAEVRAIRMRDLSTCSSCAFVPTCTRCPGLAFMEGNMRGPSSADCEKSMLRAAAGAR